MQWIMEALFRNEEVKNDSNTNVVVDKDKYGLYTLGKTLGPKNALGVTVATSDALQTWQTMQKTFAGTTPDYGQDIVDSFSIIATTDSTINETITSDYGENAINKIPSMLGGGIERLFQSANKISALLKGNVAAVGFSKNVRFIRT